jgi:Uma2 family endonuclease
MPLTRVKLSYEEYFSLPEDTRPCELIDGELYRPPSPHVRHQKILGRLYQELENAARPHRLGEVFLSPLDVVLDTQRPLVVQPDLIFVSTERLPIIGQRIEGAPDLVVEVLSPTSALRDRTEKSVWYGQYGVREYWVVDPESRTIEVRRLAPEGYEPVGTFGIGDTLRSEIMADLRIPVAIVFD